MCICTHKNDHVRGLKDPVVHVRGSRHPVVHVLSDLGLTPAYSSNNAFHSRDTLVYAASAETRGLDSVIDLLSDVALRPLLTSQEVCVQSFLLW